MTKPDYDRAYREANKEKVAARHAAWLANNEDHMKAYFKAYREANAEKISARKKARYAANPEPQRAASRLRQATRSPEAKAEHNARVREWARLNPDSGIARTHRHRARKRAAGGSYTADEWITLKAQYGNQCLRCRTPEADRPLSVDHVIPVALGGSTDITNIQPLCLPCNRSKGAKHIDFREEFRLNKTLDTQI